MKAMPVRCPVNIGFGAFRTLVALSADADSGALVTVKVPFVRLGVW